MPNCALNLLAAVRLDRALVPAMIDAGRGAVVHISSIQRKMPLSNGTLAYAAAKAALSDLQQGLGHRGRPIRGSGQQRRARIHSHVGGRTAHRTDRGRQ